MQTRFPVVGATTALLFGLAAAASAQQQLDRTHLPIREPERPTYDELDVRNAEAPPRFDVRAPEGAPNGWSARRPPCGRHAVEGGGGHVRRARAHEEKVPCRHGPG